MRLTAFCVVLLTLAPLAAGAEQPFDYNQSESPARPTPAWVKMIDLGERDPALKGYRAPAGVKVEVVAREPNVVNPVAMRFADDGSLLVIEWKVGRSIEMVDTTITLKDGSVVPHHQWHKDVPDTLKRLSDTDGDGTFDKSADVLTDLQLPSSVLQHDGWTYFTTRGGVTRRRQSNPGDGNPFDVSERIVQGLCGFNQHQASGLTISPDGWLFVTSGDDDDHAEGSDGTRIDSLRTGEIWQMRPDGTRLSLYARGFRNPYRDVVFDAYGNMFHVDNDNEDGSKFQGCRLIHVMEEADYGWRLRPTVRCCWPDADRGAVWGERPGKMPSMLKTGRGAPAGLLMYQGTGFPQKLFHGLLVYPDVFQRNVRAYRVARDGSTFKVTEQFTLLETDDGEFRPCQALQGPDGAIYLCDWRTNSAGPAAAWGDGEHGRIWRLTWEGTPDEPAIPRGPMDAWDAVQKADEPTLWKLLDSEDITLRDRALGVLTSRGEASRAGLIKVALDEGRPATARAAAIMGAATLWNDEVQATAYKMLAGADTELQRLSAELIGRNISTNPAVAAAAEDAIGGLLFAATGALGDGLTSPAGRRAAALALSRWESTLPPDAAAHAGLAGYFYGLLRNDDKSDRFLHDGFLRAVERVGKSEIEWIESAALSDKPDARDFGVGELESLRTREGAAAIDRVLREAKHLSAEQTTRLLTAYRYIQVEPAVDPSPLANWLETHPDAPPVAQAAALESIALMGQGDAGRVLPIVLKILKHSSEPLRRSAVKVISEQRLLAAAKPLMETAKDANLSLDERRQMFAALANLRGERRFAQVQYDPGVLALVDDIAALATDDKAGDLRGDALGLLAQLDFGKAQPIATKMLDGNDAAAQAIAINALGADANAAKDLAQRFIDGKLDTTLLPQIAAALQRHVGGDRAAEFTELRGKVLAKGLALASDPAGAKRLEDLVRTRGNADRGRAVFLDAKKSACVTCHRIEGAGGQIGPDLTGIAKNATVAKLVESILEPSKEIKEGFEQYMVLTKAGQTYAGYRLGSEPDRVVLRDAQGKDVVIPKDQIAREARSKLSLMPDGSHAALSLDEFVDLVAFLANEDAQRAVRQNGPAAQE